MQTIRFFFFLLLVSRVQLVAGLDEHIVMRNFRIIDLDEAQLQGKLVRATLSPDCLYAGIELERGKNREICIVDLTTQEKIFLDPRKELEHYDEWLRSPLSKLYRREDRDIEWNPQSMQSHWVLFSSNGIANQQDVFLFHLEKRKFVRVTTSLHADFKAQWLEGGKSFAYIEQKPSEQIMWLMPDFHKQVKSIDRLSFSYVSIPSISEFYVDEIFSKVKIQWKVLKTTELASTILTVTPRVFSWIERDRSNTQLRVQLYSLEGKKLASTNYLEDSVSLFCGFPNSALIVIGTVMRKNSQENMQCQSFQLEHEEERYELRFIGDHQYPATPRENITTIGGANLITASRSIEESSLWLHSLSAKEDSASEIILPESIRLGDIIYIAIDAKPALEKKSEVNMLLAYAMDDKSYLATASFSVPKRASEALQRKIIIQAGANLAFARYTGDASEGDFNPTGDLWIGIQPFPELPVHATFGFATGYAKLSGTSATQISFSKYLWYGEVFAKVSYPISIDFEPNVVAMFGKGVLNAKYSSGAAIKPNHFGMSIGTDFHLNTEIDLHLNLTYRALNQDIDRLKTKSVKNDSFVTIGFGISYNFGIQL